MIKLILASQSPRRQMLLKQVVPRFEVVPSCVNEEAIEAEMGANVDSVALVKRLAMTKAMDVSRQYSDCFILGADTIVVLEGRILGKPLDADDAVKMLQFESGKIQQVYTAMALVVDSELVGQTLTETLVAMRDLTLDEISEYVATGNALDKAGSYGIQEGARSFVSWYQGCYNNIVGMPLCQVYEMLLPHEDNIGEVWKPGEECWNKGKVKRTPSNLPL